jgi:hypothetical protein
MLFSRRLHGWYYLLRALRLARVGVVGAVLVLSAGATVPREHSASTYAGKSIEDQVRERAVKRWEALIRGDLESAYGYFSRATRETYPIECTEMRPGM